MNEVNEMKTDDDGRADGPVQRNLLRGRGAVDRDECPTEGSAAVAPGEARLLRDFRELVQAAANVERIFRPIFDFWPFNLHHRGKQAAYSEVLQDIDWLKSRWQPKPDSDVKRSERSGRRNGAALDPVRGGESEESTNQ